LFAQDALKTPLQRGHKINTCTRTLVHTSVHIITHGYKLFSTPLLVMSRLCKYPKVFNFHSSSALNILLIMSRNLSNVELTVLSSWFVWNCVCSRVLWTKTGIAVVARQLEQSLFYRERKKIPISNDSSSIIIQRAIRVNNFLHSPNVVFFYSKNICGFVNYSTGE